MYTNGFYLRPAGSKNGLVQRLQITYRVQWDDMDAGVMGPRRWQLDQEAAGCEADEQTGTARSDPANGGVRRVRGKKGA
jgi:hypothetical protein